MTYRMVTECAGCGGSRLELELSLGASPPTCAMRKIGDTTPETFYPLDLLRCVDCTLVQLSCVINPDVVFPDSYPYQSGNSRQLRQHFQGLAATVPWGPGDLIVDVGANDGTLLSSFPGANRVAVDPTSQVLKAAAFADVRHEFFTSAVARRIVDDHGLARIVTACNVLAHVDDVHDVLDGIARMLAPGGVLIAENHSLASIVNGGQWDTVYHEHLRFYTPHSFARLLTRHGLGVVAVEQIDTHGGSFRAWVTRTGQHVPPDEPMDWPALRARAANARRNLRAELSDLEVVGGIGATARATTIINYCGLSSDDIVAVYEVPGSDKIGRYVPGTTIPVLDEQRLIQDQPDSAVLFSWHLASQIVQSLRDKGYRGNVIAPLPRVAYV